MPAVTEKQRRFMGADLARARAGEETRTGMSEEQLEEFAGSKPEAPLKPRNMLSRGQRAMRDRSTRGSPPFTHPEFACGYRRLG